MRHGALSCHLVPRFVTERDWDGSASTLAFVVSLTASLLGCSPLSSTSAPAASVPEVPGGQAKCKIAASSENPLVTEWPASEKANLEARLREGAVAVSYSGCDMRLLPQCRMPGSYGWRRTTTSTDVVEIRNADDLYAKLPLGAVSLEGELERTGRLAVQTTVAGQLQLIDFNPNVVLQDPSCQGATHVVGALSIGAFKLRSGGSVKARGAADVQVIGNLGGGTESEESLVREAGVPARCEESTESAPHMECSSPIQVFLRALPSTLRDRGAPGMVKVRFLPVDNRNKWDVMVGDRTLCTTPCEKWVDPAMPFSFKYDPGILQRNSIIDIPDLREQSREDRVEVKATPRKTGKLVGGILITTFAGVAVLTGVTLSAVGCSSGDSGMCVGGLITLPIGVAGLIPGVMMISSSSPTVEVRPWTSTPLPTARGPSLYGTF
jgi:hypothetical protein